LLYSPLNGDVCIGKQAIDLQKNPTCMSKANSDHSLVT